MRLSRIVCSLALVGCHAAAPATTLGDGAIDGPTTTTDAVGSGSDAAVGPTFQVEVITDDHRAIPNVMFGGWGPHLGHLLRAAGALYWVDDVCTQATCDVNHDLAVGVFRRDGAQWTDLGETALPGDVQQNTGSLALGGVLHSYGIDVTNEVVVDCSYDTVAATRGCTSLPVTLPASSNYIGAAVSPQGADLVWWTEVKDGGNGAFDYVVNYGGGWNGPRSGPIGGYNDASYIDIAFDAVTEDFTMLGELVSGLAPNWTFTGGIGAGNLTTTDAVTWALDLAAPTGDSVESTGDVFIDPTTDDAHLLAQATSGRPIYYFRPKGGAWSAPLYLIDNGYRARFVPVAGGLALVYSVAGSGLAYKLAPALTAGTAVDWAQLPAHAIPLPSGYDTIYAIYPEATIYQTAPPDEIHVAVVGADRQWEALHVGIANP